ncbi:MAG: pilus assembly protein PilM [Proteobacteria bacterium]|nr:pilus assembly protein PilM [Pseudomonadota bacterium]
MASRIFAVDLGAWSVKLAIASPGIRGASLVDVVERLVPPGDDPVEARARHTLREMIESLHLRDESGYIGVYGDQVFAQILDFPFKSLRRAELDKAVGNELEGVVPLDLEDMVYTFEPLPAVPAHADGPTLPDAQRGRVAPVVEGMRVLSYAMKRDRAEELIELGKQCGFQTRGVLACGGAAIRLVERIPSLQQAREAGAVAVIDVGHERTDVVIVASGKAVFSRSLARAGKHVTEAIARTWHLPFAQAEAAKHQNGFVASNAEPAANEEMARIHQGIVGELMPFARDLRQTFTASRARTGFLPVAAIVVGGGARLRGIAAFLTEQLGIPTWGPSREDLAAFAGLRLGDRVTEMPIDSAAMTIGAAYDAAGGRPSFDLRSGSLAVRMDLSFLRAKAVPLGASVLAIAAFAAGSAYADLYRLRKSEKVLSTRLANESAEQFGTSRSASDIIKSVGPGGTGGGGSESPLPKLSAYDILVEISSKVPDKTKITLDIDQLQISDTKVFLKAMTKTSNEIDTLKDQLKTIDCFKDVTPGAVTAVGDKQQFTMTISSSCMGGVSGKKSS